MLHHLAQTEISKLKAHGVEGLTYDEVAALQDAAWAVDRAAKKEGVPGLVSRAVVLTNRRDGRLCVLWPLTIAAEDALSRVSEWYDEGDTKGSVSAVAWAMAHGRDVDVLREKTVSRRVFRVAVKEWLRELGVSWAELGGAVEAVMAAESLPVYRLDRDAFERVRRFAEASGMHGLAEDIDALRQKLEEKTRRELAPARGHQSWGAMTATLAALTGVAPDVWAVSPTADAVDAYAALMDYEAIKAGVDAGKVEARLTREALRGLFSTTDTIAKIHKAKEAAE